MIVMNKKKITFILFLVFCLISVLIFYSIKSSQIKNTSWTLETWSYDTVSPEASTITLKFEDGKISGSSGVNTYSATYSLGINNNISLSDISSTEMASENPLLNQIEGIYYSILENVKYYNLDGDKLTLLDSDKNELLEYTLDNN
ncbi:META domain-containing protein [bacterium]|nr:META domain-containing protein [bacterium]